MENKLNKLIDVYDTILIDSLRVFMENENAKNEYIQMDEISFDEKIKDLDQLLKYAESNEFYEACEVLFHMKKQIKENNLIK